AKGTSRAGVKIRTRAAQSLRVGGSRNVVSEQFISRAMACISASERPVASKTTARGFPPKTRSVNTSTWTNRSSRATRPPSGRVLAGAAAVLAYHVAQVLALQLELLDPQQPLLPHRDHAVAAQPVHFLEGLPERDQCLLENLELVFRVHAHLRAARAMAAILSAKFTWLSSSGA